MKVVSILGSPCNTGTTATIADGFVARAKELGAETKRHFLNGMEFRGCQGCHACKGISELCVLKDDLTEVLSDLMASDIAVFATPVYYYDVSGQFKCFIDRTWSLLKPDYGTNPDPCRLASGKKAVLVVSQGDVPGKHRDVIERYSTFLNLYGYDLNIIRATEIRADSDEKVNKHRVAAKALAEKLIG